MTWTLEQRMANQRAYRAANGNVCTRRYEKTVNGFLMRAYRNMQSRAAGIQRLKAHLYRDVSVLPRDEFYAWAKASAAFASLWREWHSENSRRGATSPKRYQRESRLARAA